MPLGLTKESVLVDGRRQMKGERERERKIEVT